MDEYWEDKHHFFVCDCHCKALVITEWDARFPQDSDDICIALWRRYVSRWTWKWRLRHIRYILTRGHPYLDDVILSPKKANELGNLLVRLSGQKLKPESSTESEHSLQDWSKRNED